MSELERQELEALQREVSSLNFALQGIAKHLMEISGRVNMIENVMDEVFADDVDSDAT